MELHLTSTTRTVIDRTVLSVKNGGPRPVHVLLGGSLESPDVEVQPGVLSVMSTTARTDQEPEIPQTGGGRRLALAHWIASDNNPLTARVIVNRVWQWHFGRGLVATANNFGKMGGRPTHPELLDWLAAWLVRHEWSLKELHRLIMTSGVYRRSGTYSDIDALQQIDPDNGLLAYFPPRRLSAEEIRDSLLSCSGELNVVMGGPGVFPEINWEAALQPRHIMGAIAPAYLPSPTPAERNRRTVYAFRMRTLAHPMLEVFNLPGSDSSCQRRDETTVSPQVFALFNGRDVYLRALAMARRLVTDGESDEARIELAYRLAYGRLPTEAQRRACHDHVELMFHHHESHPPRPLPLPTEVARQMIDEQTGKPFRWREKLTTMLEYQPDPGPEAADAHTRAWAELCLVLFNSNEFLYVY